MSKIKNLTQELDAEITKCYEEYVKLHDELIPYRGKSIDEKDIPEINRILHEIQVKFAELYPAYHFIGFRQEHVNNAVNSYNSFIDAIKSAGATQAENPQS